MRPVTAFGLSPSSLAAAASIGAFSTAAALGSGMTRCALDRLGFRQLI
jgi:hypothetical protein